MIRRNEVIPSKFEMAKNGKHLLNLLFYRDKELKSIDLSKNLETIEEYSFAGCESLESIVIPESVTDLGKYTFWNCISLKEVTLPRNLKIIPEGCFLNCISLEKINLPENLKVIDKRAFGNCISLKNIDFPEKLERINFEAFFGCYEIGGMSSCLSFPKRLKEIAACSFDKTLLNRAIVYGETKVDTKAFYSGTAIDIAINREYTTFKTERLIIRPLNESDYKTTKAHCNKDNTRLMLHLSSINDKFFDGLFDITMSQNRSDILMFFNFAVCLKDSDIHIGEIFIEPVDDNPFRITKIDIGWIIAPEYRNKGYCTEAAKAVINWVKSHLHITMIKANCDIENTASIKVMEKLGMKHEYTKPRKYSDGRESEELHYSLELLDNKQGLKVAPHI